MGAVGCRLRLLDGLGAPQPSELYAKPTPIFIHLGAPKGHEGLLAREPASRAVILCTGRLGGGGPVTRRSSQGVSRSRAFGALLPRHRWAAATGELGDHGGTEGCGRCSGAARLSGSSWGLCCASASAGVMSRFCAPFDPPSSNVKQIPLAYDRRHTLWPGSFALFAAFFMRKSRSAFNHSKLRHSCHVLLGRGVWRWRRVGARSGA